MKKIISALLCAAMLAGVPMAQAAEVQPITLSKGVLGTLGSSGVSYEAKLSVPGYLGQLETTAVIDGEEENISVSVVRVGKENTSVSVELKRFGGYIYPATLYPTEYNYVEGEGFVSRDGRGGVTGKSSRTGGSLDLGSKGGFYSGRIHFYYSLEEMNYRTVDAIPNEKWTELFWFNLGVDYVLALTDKDAETFLETGLYKGYAWPGLREMLGGEAQAPTFTDGSFDHIKAVNDYENGIYSDVSTQWYAPYAARAYEVNLMRGNKDGTFYAQGKVTVAEAITIAARLHNIYYGYSGEFNQASPWYQVYVDYAVERGMIEADTFDDYTRPITRKEMASLLGRAVELTELERINESKTIPDVEADDKDYAAIQALYESGVLTGSGEDGTFLPENEINRAEAATMIARLVTPELRVKK
ncbi:MAG: S-layer homology domain-containing protein [Clostridia bacterium]|nr:S-layer homology domain-containing protein [Clostridia bacterium]